MAGEGAMASTTIRIYFDPKTGMFCRVTNMNQRRDAFDKDFKWKPFEKLLPRHQTAISLVNMAPDVPTRVYTIRQSLPGVGSRRTSSVHRSKDFIAYFLTNESWSKNFVKHTSEPVDNGLCQCADCIKRGLA